MTREQDSTALGDEVPDEIERSIRIAASPQQVWDVISEPGWFINDGEPRAHEVIRDGDQVRVTDPVHGSFVLRVEVEDPPHRSVVRWLGGDAGEIDERSTNTVEFTITPDPDGCVLTVRERGFASLDEDARARRRRYEENTAGWIEELALAQRVAEGTAR